MPTQIITCKGRPLYTNGDGYYYKVFRRSKGDYRYFKCHLRRCQVGGTVPRDFPVTDDEIVVKGKHNHPPNFYHFEYLEAEKRLMERAVREPIALRQILHEELANAPPPIAERLNSPGIVRRMQRRRLSEQQTIIPKTLTAFAKQLLTSEFSNFANVNGRQFFIGSIGNDGLLFISPTMRELLREPNGTFIVFQTNKIIGKNLKNVFIIARIISYLVIPIVYVAHRQSDQPIFSDIFQKVLEEEPSWNPSTLYTYRDPVLVSTIIGTFPGIDVQHSWFHVMQEFRKEVKRLNLWQLVHSDPDIYNCVEILQALPFLPVNYMAAGLNAVKMRAMNLLARDDVQPLLQYVDENWMSEDTVQKISVFNHPERFMIELKQLHRQITGSFRVNMHFDMIWTFIKSLNVLEKKYASAYKSCISNNDLPRWTNVVNIRAQHRKLQKFMQEFTILKMDSFFKDISRLHINVMELVDEDLEASFESEKDESDDSNSASYDNSRNDEDLAAEYEEFIVEDEFDDDGRIDGDVKGDTRFVQDDDITNIEISDEEFDDEPVLKRIKTEARKSSANSTLIFSSPFKPITIRENGIASTSSLHRCLDCKKNTYSYACQPCGHLCICDSCKTNIVKKKCPMCLKSVMWVQQISLPYALS